MDKILVTGFEPFGGRTENASWEAVRRLPEQIGAYSIVKKRLPTVFGQAAEQAVQAAQDVSPAFVLCVGEAGTGKRLHLEQIGINLRCATIPDNAGAQPMNQPIRPDGADGYFATIPVQTAVTELRQMGVPVDVSYSAGTYVCNDLLYSVLYAHRNTPVKCGFIHVPTDMEYEELSDYLCKIVAQVVGE
jgi:pyroglutamyl-peptidase